MNYLFQEDSSSQIFNLGTKKGYTIKEIFNLGTKKGYTIKEIFKTAEELLN
ncbi:TPA: UDP-glucose 4-epimerase [Streptococcus pneumoniae]|uniref:UDP-galactose 4-epimerase n=1 Tax=Streptococcus pneumoniae TaxID=1313 RepID=A0A0T8SJQ8_STREE|nr:hypothetical protein [Streptococcus pneumoniae]EDK66965.1 hypothetical protein CGSSp14BS69_10656 [Streptococcus pneumoniae SP14-BS69]EHD35483.1 UDP-glucose 4-epimerase [Streptococcus pneumoniae GA44288]EHD45682.1 UDP-glucose 4-epimerase [Streptococcus pneumoniae GA49138]EHD71633.1 UDP-glucose 4-epimerase [Streptococcus pneumoniae GA18523]EHD84877.1 hypothetical protein SPAR30_1750 [Streptococcus pneumoniae GA13455]EHD85579.1 hypothetical protein SPAR31_2218 [Streptococcus pneumoniae GA1349